MLRTLIVDDEPLCRKSLSALMAGFGTCDAVASGKDALAAFEAAITAGQPYGLICLDIFMPDMDGHRTLAELRLRESTMGIRGGARAKVFMTTSSADPKDISSALRGECDAYLVKPIFRDRMTANLTELGLLSTEHA